MDVDAILYHQDVEMTVAADATQAVPAIQVLVLAETTAVYGLSCFLSSVEDAAVIHLATDATTAASGSFFSSYSVEDVEIIHGETTAADVTTAAVNYIYEESKGCPMRASFLISLNISL